MLALTFDDGPDPRGTPAVLEALAAVDVRATFFVLGKRVERNPALVARVLDEGHSVEVHAYEHLRHTDYSRQIIEADLNRALEALQSAGVTATRWRVPWGRLADFTADLASAHRLELVGWTHDTHDWRGDSAQTMLGATTLTHGGIVLAHDGIGPGARRQTAQSTAALIAPLVEQAREQGLGPGPLTPSWPIPIPVGNPEFDPGVGQAA